MSSSEKFDAINHTVWAKGTKHFAAKASNHLLQIFDLKFKMLYQVRSIEKIKHIIHIFEDHFLIFSELEITLFDSITKDKKVIRLKEKPVEIISGAVLDSDKFFLHVLNRNNSYEGRVYTLEGKLVSAIKVSCDLM